MIQVDPAVVYNKYIAKETLLDRVDQENEAKIRAEQAKYDSLPWWKKSLTKEFDHMWNFSKSLPHGMNRRYMRRKYNNLITACEYAIAHNIKTIDLPAEYAHVLGWPDQ